TQERSNFRMTRPRDLGFPGNHFGQSFARKQFLINIQVAHQVGLRSTCVTTATLASIERTTSSVRVSKSPENAMRFNDEGRRGLLSQATEIARFAVIRHSHLTAVRLP